MLSLSLLLLTRRKP
ncbi:MAG: hypothetical protein ACKPKO_13015 [Candidatus Fonsibacter sp.]